MDYWVACVQDYVPKQPFSFKPFRLAVGLKYRDVVSVLHPDSRVDGFVVS